MTDQKKIHKKEQPITDKPIFLAVVAIAAILILFNQWQLAQLSTMISGGSPGGHNAGVSSVLKKATVLRTGSDLGSVDLSGIQSTAQAMAAVLPIGEITDAQSAIDLLVPTGTPEYGEALGVSFDQPVPSMHALQRLYNTLKDDIKKNDPETWQRYLNLATRPVGISCEFCCGVGATGITKNGDLTCGCSHAPALQAVTLWLMQNTEMTDAEIVREVLRWKTIWFPRDMVGIGMQLAGGDTSVLHNVPGMVGGC